MEPLIMIVCGVFFVAGLASMRQAVKNVRTSSDLETGRWFTIGLIMAAGSAAVAWFMIF